MVFSLVQGHKLKGAMSKFLEPTKWNNQDVYVIPYRTCGPIGLYNPTIRRKYYEMTCNGVYIKFTFAYLDIENSEWNLLQQEFEKNRVSRISWINDQIVEALKFADAYIEAKKSAIAAASGNDGINKLIASVNTEKTQLTSDKTSELKKYNEYDVSLKTAQRELADLYQSRVELNTKLGQLTGFIAEQKKAVDALKNNKSTGEGKSSGFRTAADKAKSDFSNAIKSLKIEASSDAAALDAINLNDYEATVKTVSAILP